MDKIRQDLLQEVSDFFTGPRGEEEELEDKPLDMYISGILHPRDAPEEVGADDDADAGDDSKAEIIGDDSKAETRHQLGQNSVGLRVHLKKSVERITLEIDYARYFLTDDGKWERRDLKRRGLEKKFELEIGKGDSEFMINDESGKPESKISWYHHDGDGFGVLNVFLENIADWVNPDDDDDEENADKKKEKKIDFKEASRINNTNTIFQPFLSLRSDSREFEMISSSSTSFTKCEDEMFDMLYRSNKVYAQGYGCAADWNDDGSGPTQVNTSTIPHFFQKTLKKFSDGKKGDTGYPSRIDMHELCCFEDLDDHNANRLTIKKKLTPLVDQYAEWIKNKKQKSDGSELQSRNMKKCDRALTRMREGLETLTKGGSEKHDKITKSFVLANRAMLYQRLHFGYALSRSKGIAGDWPDVKKPGQSFWYPFQIAFLLMSVNGIADKHHRDNDSADLIWFPTGGGKTEAYLSVAAFTMILRRLGGEPEDGLGVSVIMRYTLRLLTLQQFERASTLVCALEYLRRKTKKRNGENDTSLGKDPFLLGLWVGFSLTPNHYKPSQEALDLYRGAATDDIATPNGSPWQTSYCPWCGEKITPSQYSVKKDTKWTAVKCPNTSGHCIFTDTKWTDGKVLPLVTVDTDIYSRCPSMVIATVDKFARLPFKSEIANMFGRPARRCDLHGFLPAKMGKVCVIDGKGTHEKTKGKPKVKYVRTNFPPDLIIQDELHLISGPLGTMVGLYETAVDYLCRKSVDGKETRPKIIASTATVKGAEEQIRKIFNVGKTAEFPPPALDRRDSFFWWETADDGKMFVGLSFSRASGKYALARSFASILQRIKLVRDGIENDSSLAKDEKKDQIRDFVDPYWTLVGYYNSIRELGGATRLVEDDVKTNIKFLTEMIHNKPNECARDPGSHTSGIEELTGRKNQRQINQIRELLEQQLPDPRVVSILLATNMIQVGIDIDRLGLMLVNGHPKSSTEYIQATGRIGRRPKTPGIVFSLYNRYKPRDLSQYENFMGFHKMMQKYVEPSTLTPFASGAYGRAIHAVLIGMIRLKSKDQYLSENEDADKFKVQDGDEATKFILERFRSVEQQDENSYSYKQLGKKLETLKDNWKKFIDETEKSDDYDKGVWYENPYNPSDPDGENKNPRVLMDSYADHDEDNIENFPIRTPESLREVEIQIDMEYAS